MDTVNVIHGALPHMILPGIDTMARKCPFCGTKSAIMWFGNVCGSCNSQNVLASMEKTYETRIKNIERKEEATSGGVRKVDVSSLKRKCKICKKRKLSVDNKKICSSCLNASEETPTEAVSRRPNAGMKRKVRKIVCKECGTPLRHHEDGTDDLCGECWEKANSTVKRPKTSTATVLEPENPLAWQKQVAYTQTKILKDIQQLLKNQTLLMQELLVKTNLQLEHNQNTSPAPPPKQVSVVEVPSVPYANTGPFFNIYFIVTGMEESLSNEVGSQEDMTREDISNMIISLGGTILKNMDMISELIDTRGVILVSDKPQGTLKYFLARAYGVACVQWNWIVQCEKAKHLLNISSFLLAPREVVRKVGVIPIYERMTILSNACTLLEGDEDFMTPFTKVIRAVGGKIVNNLDELEGYAIFNLDGEGNKVKIDKIVFVKDKQVMKSPRFRRRFGVSSTHNKYRKRFNEEELESSEVKSPRRPVRAALLSIKWLTDSLIEGKALNKRKYLLL